MTSQRPPEERRERRKKNIGASVSRGVAEQRERQRRERERRVQNDRGPVGARGEARDGYERRGRRKGPSDRRTQESPKLCPECGHREHAGRVCGYLLHMATNEYDDDLFCLCSAPARESAGVESRAGVLWAVGPHVDDHPVSGWELHCEEYHGSVAIIIGPRPLAERIAARLNAEPRGDEVLGYEVAMRHRTAGTVRTPYRTIPFADAEDVARWAAKENEHATDRERWEYIPCALVPLASPPEDSPPEDSPSGADQMMQFAPLHGWLKNGMQKKQKFPGWHVYAHEPKEPATPVVLMTREDYDAMCSPSERRGGE